MTSNHAAPPRPVKPDIAVSPAQAQTIVDRLGAGQTVAQVSTLQGGAIGAIYEVSMRDGAPSLVLKVYPESLHWKMQKEVNVCALLSGQLGVPVPRVLLADDTKSVIGLNFVLMNKLDGAVLRTLEPALPDTELFSAYSQMGQASANPSYFDARLRLHRAERHLDRACKQSRLHVIAVRDQAGGVCRA